MAIVARRPDVLEETKSEIESASDGRVFAYPCGISDSAQVAEMFRSAESDLGVIDILVNNAGSACGENSRKSRMKYGKRIWI